MSVGHSAEYEVDQRGFDALLAKPWFLREYLRRPRVDSSWDIPYVGGVSLDNSTVYVDRHAFIWITRNGYLPALIAHEHVEGILMAHGWQYELAHHIANAAENEVYRRVGIDPKSTQQFWNELIRKAGDETVTRCPPDLNTEPYKSDERHLAAVKAAQAGRAIALDPRSARKAR